MKVRRETFVLARLCGMGYPPLRRSGADSRRFLDGFLAIEAL
jgi:hypothetical protein